MDKIAGGAGRRGEELRRTERILARWPEVVEEAAKSEVPNLVAAYLTALASAFNSFYAAEKIIGGEGEKYKIKVAGAVEQVLKNGLWILGIEAAERM